MSKKSRLRSELLKFVAIVLFFTQWVGFPVRAQDDTLPFEEESLDEVELDAEIGEAPATATEKTPPKKKATASKGTNSEKDLDEGGAKFESEDIGFEDFEESTPADSKKSLAEDESGIEDPDAIELEPLDSSDPPVVDNLFDTPADAETKEAPPIESPGSESIASPEPVQTPAPVAEVVSDEPDLNLEARLHNIYMTFHSKAIPSQDWQMLVGGRQSDVYSIQRGDNLWNVSKTLFNDGNYWPKIWSLNRKIENPHEINPGDQLRFVMGTEEDAPTFAVVPEAPAEEATTLPEQASSSSAQQMIDDLGVEIPPPLVESQPVLKNPPPSLPEWRVSNQSGNYDSSGIHVEGRKKVDLKSDIYLTAFVEDQGEPILGKVVEVEGGISTAMEYQYIYIAARADSLREGQKVLLTQVQGKIKPKNDWIKEEDLGVEVWVQGEATIESKASSKELEPGQELYRALVRKAISNVVVGSEIRPGNLTEVDMSLNGPRSESVAQISGGLDRMNRDLHSEQTIVFLTRGSGDGLAEGQIVPVRPIEQLRNPKSKVDYSPRTLGYVRIVKTTPRFATGLVVKAWEDIRTGDMTGKGELLSAAGGSKSSVEVIEGEDSDDAIDEDFSEESFSEDQSEFE